MAGAFYPARLCLLIQGVPMSRILASIFAGLFAAGVLVTSPVVHAAKAQTTTTKKAKSQTTQPAKAKADKKSASGKKQQKKSTKKPAKSAKTAKSGKTAKQK